MNSEIGMTAEEYKAGSDYVKLGIAIVVPGGLEVTTVLDALDLANNLLSRDEKGAAVIITQKAQESAITKLSGSGKLGAIQGFLSGRVIEFAFSEVDRQAQSASVRRPSSLVCYKADDC